MQTAVNAVIFHLFYKISRLDESRYAKEELHLKFCLSLVLDV